MLRVLCSLVLQDGIGELFHRQLFRARKASRVSAPLVPGGTVSSFALSPDGTTYCYRADQDALGVVELCAGNLTKRRLEPR